MASFSKFSEQAIRSVLLPEPQPITVLPQDPGFKVPPDFPGRPSAVLLPLHFTESEWRLLYTRRTEHVQDHKGQVSFPGGAADPDDRSPADTAIREAWEEIGLQPDTVRVLGYMRNLLSISGFVVTPVVGVIEWPFEIILSASEVSRAFTVPLDWLADSINYSERLLDPENNLLRRKTYIYNPYEGEVVWGLSARITIEFIELLLQSG